MLHGASQRGLGCPMARPHLGICLWSMMTYSHCSKASSVQSRRLVLTVVTTTAEPLGTAAHLALHWLLPTSAPSGGPWSGIPQEAGPGLGSPSACMAARSPTPTGSSEFTGRDKRGQLSFHEGGRQRTTQPGVRPQEVAGTGARWRRPWEHVDCWVEICDFKNTPGKARRSAG